MLDINSDLTAIHEAAGCSLPALVRTRGEALEKCLDWSRCITTGQTPLQTLLVCHSGCSVQSCELAPVL